MSVIAHYHPPPPSRPQCNKNKIMSLLHQSSTSSSYSLQGLSLSFVPLKIRYSFELRVEIVSWFFSSPSAPRHLLCTQWFSYMISNWCEAFSSSTAFQTPPICLFQCPISYVTCLYLQMLLNPAILLLLQSSLRCVLCAIMVPCQWASQVNKVSHKFNLVIYYSYLRLSNRITCKYFNFGCADSKTRLVTCFHKK